MRIGSAETTTTLAVLPALLSWAEAILSTEALSPFDAPPPRCGRGALLLPRRLRRFHSAGAIHPCRRRTRFLVSKMCLLNSALLHPSRSPYNSAMSVSCFSDPDCTISSHRSYSALWQALHCLPWPIAGVASAFETTNRTIENVNAAAAIPAVPTITNLNAFACCFHACSASAN